jgi:hypothetical protein
MASSRMRDFLMGVVAVLCVAGPGQAQTSAPTNGLVGHWKFDEVAGTTAADSSGSGNAGTLVGGAVWTPSGRINGALTLDGVNDYVSLRVQSLPPAFTLGAWVWVDAAGTAANPLLSLNNRVFYLASNTVYSYWNNGSAGSASFGAVPTASWQHITYTYDGITLRGFRNAVQFATTTNASISSGSAIPRIGSDEVDDDYFSGMLDDVRLYNRALSAQEVLDVYMDTGLPPDPDTIPPSTPTGLAASVVSSSRIDLSWAASNDNVGVAGYRVYRCQGDGCALATQIGTSTTTSYADSGLTPSTSYTYAVEAYDAANNNSTFSAPVSAITPTSGDGIAPTVAVTAPAAGAVVAGTSITLAANASDNVGVVGVRFLVDGVELGSEDTIAPYSIVWNTAGAPSGPHVVSARARDAAGNIGASDIAITLDNQGPTGSILINGGATATNSRITTLTLSAVDAFSTVTHMRFSNTGSSYSAAEVYAATKTWTLSTTAGTKTVYVQFRDARGNWSPAFTDTIVYDTSAPTISSIVASNVMPSSATISWTTSEPATSQVEYGLTTAYGSLTTLDPQLVTSHTVQLSGLSGQTLYNYRVRSRDAAGNQRISTNRTFTTPGVSIPLTITVTQTENGTIVPGTTTVSPGTDAVFTINPNADFVISSVTVDGVNRTAAATWTDLGSQPGNNRIRAIVSLGGGVAVAGGETMLRSTDNGLTWTNLGALPNGVIILELISLGNGVVIAGTTEGRLFRSTNGGATWTNLGTQFAQTHIYALENLGNGIALAGTQPGGLILRSTDYGATWTNLGRQGTETQIISIENLGNNVVVAGCGVNGHILRSTDNGLTWTNLGTQGGELDIDYITSMGNGIAVASTYPNGKLLRSTDNGLTWNDLGQFDAGGVMSEVVSAGNGLAIAGAGTTGHLWRTVDYGATWVDLGRLGTDTLLRPAYLDDQVFVVGTGPNGKIFRTTNKGYGTTGTYTFSNVQTAHTLTATYAPAVAD